MRITGRCSVFGGPNDSGVSSKEGLALVEPSDLASARFSFLFLPSQPAGTTGLARRLNPNQQYIAMRWDYKTTPREYLRNITTTVSANGKSITARPVDWGPNDRLNRVADLSPFVAAYLGVKTDHVVTVEFPLPHV